MSLPLEDRIRQAQIEFHEPTITEFMSSQLAQEDACLKIHKDSDLAVFKSMAIPLPRPMFKPARIPLKATLYKLFQRLKWAFKALTGDFSPVIYCGGGVYVDLDENRVVLPSHFHLHARGQLKISSDEDVIVQSGRIDNFDRPGYKYSYWVNPIYFAGKPIHAYPLRNAEGALATWLGIYDDVGRPLYPDGFRPTWEWSNDAALSPTFDSFPDKQIRF